MISQKLLNHLKGKALVEDVHLERVMDLMNKTGKSLEESLITTKIFEKEQLLTIIGNLHSIEWVDLAIRDLDHETAHIIPVSMAKRYMLLCVEKQEKTITCAMADPTDVFALDDLRLRTGLQVKPVYALSSDIEKAISEIYDANVWNEIMEQAMDSGGVAVIEEQDSEEQVVIDAPVVKLVDKIFSESVRLGASDIHIEPFQKEVLVRFRIDGQLQEIMQPPKKMISAMVSRIKIMADLDIAERRIPQDGRIKINAEGRALDVRVSILPTMCGESVVMRLLDSRSIKLSLDDLGFPKGTLGIFEEAVKKPNGIVLVTGPTGSGKSTTLYATLSTLNTPNTKILTVEDPVEYYLRGINQVQCRPKVGLTFAAALRSFLRQDPDIILVGEIRDKETAEIAVESALTGHLVLSTLHTNSAVGSLTRIADMGIEPFLIGSSLNAILAQRLLRRICPVCVAPVELASEHISMFAESGIDAKDIKLMKGKGCESCFGSGYKGRLGIYEVLNVSREVQSLIINNKSEEEVLRQAKEEGFRTLRDDGLEKAAAGVTTIEEVLRVSVSQ